MAIPLSFAITLIVLYATGDTLNAFTLGGLTLAMGRLVDDAVVVLESIHRHQKEGMDPYQAALNGANAVALPVLASTVTTIAVLLPVVLLEGLAKKLFAPLALTVAVAMIASYFVSMAVTPVACRYLARAHPPGPLAARLESAITGIARRLRLPCWPGCSATAGWCWRRRPCWWCSAWSWPPGSPAPSFPEIDESMERIYVRAGPGHLAQGFLANASTRWAQLSRRSWGTRWSWCSPTSACPARPGAP